jgi:CheY-like chemotaxis protein
MLLNDKHIFVVEDQIDNRAIVRILLEQNGAKVAFDRWGNDTLRLLHLFAPVDIILLDLMFPNKFTGYDIFDQIRAVPKFVNIPILAVSAADPSEAIPKTKRKGFAGFIAKPIDYELFAHQIVQVLNQEPVWHIGER